MIVRNRLHGDDRGVATIEMAFALPILVAMIWAFVQLGQIYRATAGIQQALGEGARYATLCLTPTATTCTIPSAGTGTSPAAGTIKKRIYDSVYGIGPGTFTVPDFTLATDAAGGGKYYDLTVNYTQDTNLLVFPGPTITISRSKRVWVATS